MCESAFCMLLGVNEKRVPCLESSLSLVQQIIFHRYEVSHFFKTRVHTQAQHQPWKKRFRMLKSNHLHKINHPLNVSPFLSQSCQVRRLKLGLGTNNVPVDRRKYNGKVPGEKASSVDSFFSYCYWNMASCCCESWSLFFLLKAFLLLLNLASFCELRSLCSKDLGCLRQSPLLRLKQLKKWLVQPSVHLGCSFHVPSHSFNKLCLWGLFGIPWWNI